MFCGRWVIQFDAMFRCNDKGLKNDSAYNYLAGLNPLGIRFAAGAKTNNREVNLRGLNLQITTHLAVELVELFDQWWSIRLDHSCVVQEVGYSSTYSRPR
jgi:hypothetical protein